MHHSEVLELASF